MPKTPNKAKKNKYNPEYYHFEVEINDYGNGTQVPELERLLKPFYQFAEVKGVRKPYEDREDA